MGPNKRKRKERHGQEPENLKRFKASIKELTSDVVEANANKVTAATGPKQLSRKEKRKEARQLKKKRNFAYHNGLEVYIT